MARLKILTYPDTVLKQRASEVLSFDDELKKFVSDMAETMYAAPGIGLAANQAGVLKRVIVVDVDYRDENKVKNLRVLINPVITSSEGVISYEEGCLSLPNVNEEVERAKKITVKAFDIEGKEFTLEAEDLLAVCIQHETDHLDGILLIDRISKLKRDFYKNKLRKEKLARQSETTTYTRM